MVIRKAAMNRGFSLMELILAVAIVGILSSIALPNYIRHIESTREKICSINMQEVLNDYLLYCISVQEIPLSDYMLLEEDGKDRHFCPSGGLPVTDGSGETAALACSVHEHKLTLPDESSFAFIKDSLYQHNEILYDSIH